MAEMADPIILGINAKYMSGGKRRRVRKKAVKIPLPEPVIALLKDDAKKKYLASFAPMEAFAPMEVDEDMSSIPAPSQSSSSSSPDPLPGTSGTHQIDSSESENEEEEEEIGLDDPEVLQQCFDEIGTKHALNKYNQFT